MAKTAPEILSEYATHMGASRCRLVPLSVWDAFLAQLCDADVHIDAAGEGSVKTAGPKRSAIADRWHAELVEPLHGQPVCVTDIKGRAHELATLRERGPASVTPFLIADVRRFGCELSPACRLGAWLACDVDPGLFGYVVVGIAKDASGDIATLIESVAVDVDGVAVVPHSNEAREARRASRHRANDAAAVIAAYLHAHPKVAQVSYPGLKDGEQFRVAATQLIGGFGPIIDVQTQERPAMWQRIIATDEDPKQQIMKLVL